MNDLLARIVASKQAEVAALKARAGALRAAAESLAARGETRPFSRALRSGTNVAVIAEYKRRSPSAGAIREQVAVDAVARAYSSGGAAAMSVLTDEAYFGGSMADLQAARQASGVPVLRKDFVVDETQIWEAREAGADAVLLIVRILDDAKLRGLMAVADAVGLAALVEVHDELELERALRANARIVGINNRDLATFTVDLARAEALAPAVPAAVTVVGESGVKGAHDVRRLAAAGVDAVLVGETVMRAADPAASVARLASAARRLARGPEPGPGVEGSA